VELRFALLAEKVTVGSTSAITAEGILLDAFLVEKFPVAHPLLYLLIRLNAAISEAPDHRLEIRALDDEPFTMVSQAAGLPLYSTQIVRITQPRFTTRVSTPSRYGSTDCRSVAPCSAWFGRGQRGLHLVGNSARPGP
jgi:hypothetical protein